MKREYVEPPPLARVLRKGMSGDDVKAVQQILLEEGFFQGTPLGNFKKLTLAAVKYFQGTHIGEDGEFLDADGVVGPATWWALHNPNGSAQRSGIAKPTDAPVAAPDGAAASTVVRMELVRAAYALHAKGVREVPDGSNYGDGVTPIVNACGFKYGIPWCMAQASFLYRETTDEKPLGAMHVSCSGFWNAAHKAGKAHPKRGYKPVPGDIAIYNYAGGLRRNGTLAGAGHATLVVRVDDDGAQHNAIEGNAGNRCKHSIRKESDRRLVGYVNLFGDAGDPPHDAFPQGVVPRPTLELTLAGSR